MYANMQLQYQLKMNLNRQDLIKIVLDNMKLIDFANT